MRSPFIEQLTTIIPKESFFNSLDTEDKKLFISHVLGEREELALKKRCSGLKYVEIAEDLSITKQGAHRACTLALDKIASASDLELAFSRRISLKLRRAGIDTIAKLNALSNDEIESLGLLAAETKRVFLYLERIPEQLIADEKEKRRVFIKRIMQLCEETGGLDNYQIEDNSIETYEYILDILLDKDQKVKRFYKNFGRKSEIPDEIIESVKSFDEDAYLYGDETARYLHMAGIANPIPVRNIKTVIDFPMLACDPSRTSTDGLLPISFFDVAFMPGSELGEKEEILKDIPHCNYTENQKQMLKKLKDKFHCDYSDDMMCALICSLNEEQKTAVASFLSSERKSLPADIISAFASPLTVQKVAPFLGQRLKWSGIDDVLDMTLLNNKDLEYFCAGYISFYASLFNIRDAIDPGMAKERLPHVFSSLRITRDIPVSYEKSTGRLAVGQKPVYINELNDQYSFWRDAFLYNTVSLTELLG